MFEIICIGIGLAMDAFAVSVTNGLCSGKGRKKAATGLVCAAIFGIYQGIMPAIGYAFGKGAGSFIERIDHYIALGLLSFIGIKMIFGAGKEKKDAIGDKLTFGVILIQGFATSLDALAVGVSFAALSVNIVFSAGIICLVTFIISLCGFLLGGKIGEAAEDKAETAGGIVLIVIGLKIFAEHILI